MGFREATPGLALALAATILLALVSFNVPLLKSLNFLTATYDGTSAGNGLAATARFGTLGYCYDYSFGSSSASSAASNCTSPTVGYTFDPNTIFGISEISIPSSITKYLTYALVLHIVALGCSVLAIILGALSHIRGFALLCFPTCASWLTSAITLIAFVFDLAIFYIAKTRIDQVSGASASIGACVWMTLAAWILTGLSGCAYGFGRCCAADSRRHKRDRSKGDYRDVDSEAANRGLVAGPPLRSTSNNNKAGYAAREQEVSVPLTAQVEDTYGEQKYLEDDHYAAQQQHGDLGYGNHSYPPGAVGGRMYGASNAAGVGVGVGGGGAAPGAAGYVPGSAIYGQGYSSGGYGAVAPGAAAAAVRATSWDEHQQQPQQSAYGQHPSQYNQQPYDQQQQSSQYAQYGAGHQYQDPHHQYGSEEGQGYGQDRQSYQGGHYSSTSIPQPQPTGPLSPVSSTGGHQANDYRDPYTAYGASAATASYPPAPQHPQQSYANDTYVRSPVSPVASAGPSAAAAAPYHRSQPSSSHDPQNFADAYAGAEDGDVSSVRPPSYSFADGGAAGQVQAQSQAYGRAPGASEKQPSYFR